jgi:hypothetical protein
MNEEKKSLMIAEAENVEAIRDFFTSWWSSAELYESAAKVSATIIDLVNRHQIKDCELFAINQLLQQYLMMIDTIKPFEEKEAAHE